MPYYTLKAKFNRDNILGRTELGERVATGRYAMDVDSARSKYSLQVCQDEPGVEIDSMVVEVTQEL